MKKIPNMISTKDMAYFNDIFNWNNIAAKKTEFYINNCKDEDVLKELKKLNKIHTKNCNEILKLIRGVYND